MREEFMRRQRGEGQLGCIFGLIVLVAAGYIAYKMIPVKVKAADLRQEITDVARSAATYKNTDLIAKRILEKADELDLPLEPDGLQVERKSDRIYIEANYTVPVEFPGYTYQWNFKHVADNPVF
jgi:cell division protein FtsL